jgi:hypothetical protein
MRAATRKWACAWYRTADRVLGSTRIHGTAPQRRVAIDASQRHRLPALSPCHSGSLTEESTLTNPNSLPWYTQTSSQRALASLPGGVIQSRLHVLPHHYLHGNGQQRYRQSGSGGHRHHVAAVALQRQPAHRTVARVILHPADRLHPSRIRHRLALLTACLTRSNRTPHQRPSSSPRERSDSPTVRRVLTVLSGTASPS